MLNDDGTLWAWLAKSWQWITAHPLGSWTAFSAFVISVWSSLRDGKGWVDSLCTGTVATIVCLGIIAWMKKAGLHDELWPVVGMIFSFVGVDRIRAAIRGAWDSYGNKFPGFYKGNKKEDDER